MTARTRWVLAVVGVLIAVAFLLGWLTFGPRRADRVGTSWVVEPGETLTLPASVARPDDEYRCPGRGGVNGTPEPGTGVAHSGGLTVTTADDGTVTATCEPGSPGNV